MYARKKCETHDGGGAGTIYLEHSGHRLTGENLGALIIYNTNFNDRFHGRP